MQRDLPRVPGGNLGRRPLSARGRGGAARSLEREELEVVEAAEAVEAAEEEDRVAPRPGGGVEALGPRAAVGREARGRPRVAG